MRSQIPTKHINLDSANIDPVPSNSKHSGSSAMLCVFVDNEAVIKMIVKGWSPTISHVTWTHRVALDWLLDRINVDTNSNLLHWHQTPICRHVDLREFHTWWVELSSSFVEYQPFQLHLLYQEFQLDKLLQNGEEDSKSERGRKSCV